MKTIRNMPISKLRVGDHLGRYEVVTGIARTDIEYRVRLKAGGELHFGHNDTVDVDRP